MSKNPVCALLLFIIGLTFSFTVVAQTTFPGTLYAGWSTSTLSFGTIPNAPGLTFTQMVPGSGLTTGSTASDGFNSDGWDGPTSQATAIAANNYVTFTITANASTSFTINSLNLCHRRSGTGPTNIQVDYSVNGSPFAAFAASWAIASPNTNTFRLLTPASPVTVPVGGNFVFRVTGWGATNPAGTFRIVNNTAINGTYQGVVSIATSTVSGSPFCVNSAGTAVGVPFGITGTFSGSNVFTAQLSDASGSFAAPVNIGTLNGSSAGTIAATIPAGTPAGTSYRIRVVSSAPVAIGSDNAADLEIRPGFDLSSVATDLICNNGGDGAVASNITGGIGPFTYAWSNTATTSSISSLPAGTYSLMVTAANGCTQTTSATVTEPVAIDIDSSTSDVTCHGGTDGAALLTINGGTSPYSYLWSNSTTNPGLSSVAAGTYSVTITDNNGCQQNSMVTITEPTAISTGISSSNVNCNGGTDGSVQLNPTGGTAPYSYMWNTTDTTVTLSSLSAGNYSVTITDDNGCLQTGSVSITEPAAISLNTTANSASCNGSTNGSAQLSISGGTSPYTYLWSDNSTSQNLSAVGAGTYSVTVTDNNGCTQTTSATITEPAAIGLNTTASDALCNGATNGSAQLSVSGGTAPFTYLWSDNSTSQNLSSVGAGTYSVTVTDNNGCTQTTSVTITAPSTISLNTSATDVLCHGATNGAAQLNVSGGTSPFTYLWSDNSTLQNLSAVAAGSYSVTVTDNNGCTQMTNVTITEPSAITANTLSFAVLCNGGSNGGVQLNVNGGTSPYTYLWSDNSTSQNLSSVVAGTYSVTVTDNNGCTQTFSATVTQPSVLATSIVPANATCGTCADGSANLTVSGGTANYTYAWSNSGSTEDQTGLLPGTYTVTVTDANGCTSTDTTTINFSTMIIGLQQQPQSWLLYPNPSFGDDLQLQVPDGASGTMLSVKDAAGREVFRSEVPAGDVFRFRLPVSAGIYTYSVETVHALLHTGLISVVR